MLLSNIFYFQRIFLSIYYSFVLFSHWCLKVHFINFIKIKYCSICFIFNEQFSSIFLNFGFVEILIFIEFELIDRCCRLYFWVLFLYLIIVGFCFYLFRWIFFLYAKYWFYIVSSWVDFLNLFCVLIYDILFLLGFRSIWFSAFASSFMHFFDGFYVVYSVC